MHESVHVYRPSGIVRYAGAVLFGFITLSQVFGVMVAWHALPKDAGPEVFAFPIGIFTLGLIAWIRWLRIGAVLDNERLTVRKFFSSATFRLNEIGGIAIRTVLHGDNGLIDVYAVVDLEGKTLREIDTIRLLRNYEDLIARVNTITAEFVAHYQASIAKE